MFTTAEIRKQQYLVRILLVFMVSGETALGDGPTPNYHPTKPITSAHTRKVSYASAAFTVRIG